MASLRVQVSSAAYAHAGTLSHPVASAHGLLQLAAGGADPGVPPEVMGAVRTLVAPEDRWAYRPCIVPGLEFHPDAVRPDITDERGWAKHYADALGDVAPDTIVAQLTAHYGDPPPVRWLPVLADPKSWLDTLADCVRAASPMLTSMWSSARARLEVEAVRVGQLLESGGPSTLFNSLSPRVRFVEEQLQLSYRRDIDIPVRGGLRLVPLLGGPRSYQLFDSGPNICVGYSMPGALSAALHDGPAESRAGDRLGALIGDARASVLRALSVPLPVGQLAVKVGGAVSTISYHCTGLRAAGLVEPVRIGRSVWMVRTALGDEITDLLSGP